MKQDKDWTEVMRSALRDAEATPPADGWARLERELNAPAPRVFVLRKYWPRIAAAAAAVLIFVGGGELLLHENRDLGDKGFVIATATDSGSSAADNRDQSGEGKGTFGESVRAVIPSREAVSAATPPGAEPRVPVVEAVARPRNMLAAADVPEVTPEVAADAAPVRVADAGEANSIAEKQPGKQGETVAGTRSANTDKNNAGTVAQARKYPSMSSYAGDELAVYAKPRRSKTSFSLFAAGGVTGSDGVVSALGPGMMTSGLLENDFVSGEFNSSPVAQLKYTYNDYSYRHHQPLSFGLSVRKEFAHGLSLESGVNYTLLWSDASLKSSDDDISQKLHFIGVPLRMNWQFLEAKRFSLYIGAGGMVEKCVAAKFGSKSIDEPGVQWSVLGAAGAQYDLGNRVGLYFEPEVSYYFTETELRTSRTESPLSLTLRLGVRLSF